MFKEVLMNAEQRISRARIQLLWINPFLGTLALYLKVRKDPGLVCMNGHPTMGTDGKTLAYNPKFVDSLPFKETTNAGVDDGKLIGVVAHEIMHCVYQHVLEWRGTNGRVEELWTMAMEYVVNEAVTEMFRLPLPGQPFLDKKYYGMYTEQVYAELLKTHKVINIKSLQDLLKKGMIDKHIPGLTAKEKEGLVKDLKLNIARAASVAKMRGKLPSGLERIIGDILEPKIPWRQVLAEFIVSMGRDDYSWRQPNKRHLHRGIILPSLHSETVEIAVAIDTSGSIGQKELTEFWSEIKGIMGAFPSYKIYLMACDADIHSYQVLEPWDDVDVEGLTKGGGGTDFRPVFKKVEEEDIRPQALVYLTDTYGAFPDEPPPYPVLWVVTGTGEVPWGRVCEL
jgi:predicted metal-dependent peptidase